MKAHTVSDPRALQNSFHLEAVALAKMHSLKTVWGVRPCIDLKAKTLYLPRIPFVSDPIKLQSLKSKFRRWVAHECGGHARFTDPETYDRFIDDIQEIQNLWDLFMDFEDPRVDKEYSQVYAGSKMALDNGLKAMIEDKEIRDGSKSPYDALSCFVHYYGRIFHTGQDFLLDYLELARTRLTTFLEESGVHRLEAMLSTVFPTLKNSDHSLIAAKQTLDLIQEIAEEQKERQQQNPQPQSNEEEEADDSEASDSSGGKSGSDGNDDTSESDSPSQSNEEGEGDDGVDTTQDKTPGDEDSDPDASAQDILESTSEGDTATEASRAFAQAVDEVIDDEDSGAGAFTSASPALGSDGNATTAEPDEGTYFEYRNQTSGTVASLKNHVRNLILSMTRARKISTNSGPRLKQKNLWKVKMGNLNVYERKIKTPLPKSAISLVIDLSDSMTWDQPPKLTMASQVVIALAEVLQAIGTPFEVLGFGGFNHHPAGLVEIKPFNQSFPMARGKLGGMAKAAGGGTPLAEALFEAGLRLVSREEDRKLLFVITDGEPADREAAKDMANRLVLSGITTVGVGIDTNSGRDLFNRWAVVHSANDLGTEILNALYETLTGNARLVA